MSAPPLPEDLEPVVRKGGRPLPPARTRWGRWLQRRAPVDLETLRYYSNEPVPNHRRRRPGSEISVRLGIAAVLVLVILTLWEAVASH